MKKNSKKPGGGLLWAVCAALLAAALVLGGCDNPAGGGDDNGSSDDGGGGNSMETAVTLTKGTWNEKNGWDGWTTGSISKEGEVYWYKFLASSDISYYVYWSDANSSYKDVSYRCDILVSVFQSDGTTPLNGIAYADGSFANISNYGGTVYIKVQGKESSTGAYAIAYAY
jgi:predicted small secreted protein